MLETVKIRLPGRASKQQTKGKKKGHVRLLHLESQLQGPGSRRPLTAGLAVGGLAGFVSLTRFQLIFKILFFLNFIKSITLNVVLVSAIQQHESAISIYIYPLPP